MDLLRALAPHPAAPGATSLGAPRRSNRFGSASVMAILSAIKAVGKGAGPLGPKIKAFLADEDRKIRVYERRYKAAKFLLEHAKSESRKKKAMTSMLEAKEKLEIAKIRRDITEAGAVEPGASLDGTALEIRRNALSEEWGSASPSRKKFITKLVNGYDKDLLEIQSRVEQTSKLKASEPRLAPEPAEAAPKGSGARASGAQGRAGSAAELILPTLSDAVTPAPGTAQLYSAKGMTEEGVALLSEQTTKAAILSAREEPSSAKALTSGLGELQFVAQAPPGPGQQVRVSMYPTRPADSYAGANGILTPGDDPVLLMRLTAGAATNFVASVDYLVTTALFTYGSYRVLGFQSNPQGNYLVKTAAGLDRSTAVINGLGITIRSVTVYNGEELMLPLGDMNVDTFSIFPAADAYPGISSTSLSAFHQQGPYNDRRTDRYFVGLRTNPVMDSTARLYAIVRCFASVTTNDPLLAATGMLSGDSIEVPVSFNLIGQMLEDKVFGNPVVVGPAARAGAQVSLGLRSLGKDAQGVNQLELRNTRYISPSPRKEPPK